MKELLKSALPIVLPVIISSITTLFVYWLKKKWDRTHTKQEVLQQDIMTYVVPVISSMLSLRARLREIISERCLYLVSSPDESVINDNYYLKHKYISTLYRFCALLGTITALEHEKTFHRFSKEMKEISNHFNILKSTLADGRDIDKKIADKCIEILQGTHTVQNKPNMPSEIENAVFVCIESDDKRKVLKLDKEKQKKLMTEIASIVNRKDAMVKGKDDMQQMKALMNELSRKVIVILRDMQCEIGQSMIKPVDNPRLRHFELISLGEFEEIHNNRQFIRVIDLFYGIDFTSITQDDMMNYDERYNSIINIYITISILLQYFKENTSTREYVGSFDFVKAMAPIGYQEVNGLLKQALEQSSKDASDELKSLINQSVGQLG